MSARMMVSTHKTDPKLLELLEKAKGHVMTRAERDAQRRSWVRGEMMLEHPEMTAEHVNAILDDVLGPPIAGPAE